MSSNQAVPGPLKNTHHTTATADGLTSRSNSYFVQFLVPGGGPGGGALSSDRVPLGPSTRHHNVAAPETSDAFIHPLMCTRFPRTSSTGNCCTPIPTAVGAALMLRIRRL